MKEVDFGEVWAELVEAGTVHAAAVEVERAASHKTSAALNRLNAAQKEFDKTVNAVRDAALWNTDWHSQKNRRSVAA